MVSKIWGGMSTTILIFIYSNSKFKVTCRNVDFESRYIRTHTEEKPSKISNITFVILHFSYIKYFYWIAIPSTFESTSLDKTMRCASKWFILTQKAKSRARQYQVCYLRTTPVVSTRIQWTLLCLLIRLSLLHLCFDVFLSFWFLLAGWTWSTSK